MVKHTFISLLLISMGFSSPLLCAQQKNRKNKKLRNPKVIEQTKNESRASASPGSFSSITVNGDTKVAGTITVSENATIGEDLDAKTIRIKRTASVGDECHQGSLQVNACSNISGNMNIGKCINAQCVNTDTVTSCKDTVGALIANTAHSGSLTVNKETQIGGTLLVNEIDPLKKLTTNFSGNFAICNHKLLVNEINPVGEDGLEDDAGVTCFSGNVAVHPSKKVLANNLNPVMIDEDGQCVNNNDGIICFSGNLAVDPSFIYDADDYAIFALNNINPVTIDEQGNCFANEDGVTCFSGNVAINDDYEENPFNFGRSALLVNEIDPVILDPSCGCVKNPNLCARTNFSGNINIKNNRFFGQIVQDFESDPINLNFFNGGGNFPSPLEYPITECQPVLRISFEDTATNDPTNQPQGAWVKLDVFGTVELNGTTTTQQAITTYFDTYTELYFFVSPDRSQYPCSALIGTLNGDFYANTLSSQMCLDHPNPFRVCGFPSTGLLTQNNNKGLFGLLPTSSNALSPITILGTVAHCSDAPNNTADILLMGLLPPNTDFSFDGSSFTLPGSFTVNLNGSNSFRIINLSIFYEIISPNLDLNNPPCLPFCVEGNYGSACLDLVNTFTTYCNLYEIYEPFGAP